MYYVTWWNSLTKIHIVDKGEFSVLLRMGTPLSYGFLGWGGPEMSVPRLVDAIYKAVGVRVEDTSQLMDFSLLTQEVDQIMAERRGLGDQVTIWPTHGINEDQFQKECSNRGIESCPSTLQPRDMATEDVVMLAKTFPEWDVDHLTERVDILHSLVHAPVDGEQLSNVIFFHCACGCDRTGELAAAYGMRYLSKTFTEMYIENEDIAGRHTMYNNQVAAQWFCEHLRTKGLYSFNDCGNCEPFRCVDDGSPAVWDAIPRITYLVVSILFLVASACCLRRRCRLHQAKEEFGYDFEKLPN